MANYCINIRAKQFKDLAKQLNIGEGQLELLAYSYNTLKQDGLAFLTEEGINYIKDRLQGKTVEVGNNVYKLW